MGLDKPSSSVTTLSNHIPCFQVVYWRENEATQDDGQAGYRWEPRLIPEAEDRFWLSRDFTIGCHTWDPGGHAYDVLARFFRCRVYIDSNHRDTLGYEWPHVHCYHLIVCWMVIGWLWLWLYLSWWLLYYFTCDIDFYQHSACLCML
jgi:hypothetical protein